ncbi:hypothetical protein ACROYT_G000006 [Oculina patagonica]
MTTKKPTAEQIRYAQLLNTEDSKAMKDKIKQVSDVTGFNYDTVSIALHDCNFDTEAAINALLEGRQDQTEWVMRTNKKKKHQTPVTQGIDTIIPTSQTTPPTTTAPTSSKPGGPRQPRGKGRSRQSEEHKNSSEKDNKNEGTVNNNDRNAGESGRGRGSREDRWNDRKPGGRGGPPRRGGRGGGRPGRSFQSRGRDRPNRFGGGNRNASNSTAVNGPSVNGTEMWGDNEDDISKEKETEHTGDLIPPTTEEWGIEEWTPVEQSVTSSTDDTLFNNAVSSSHSWPTNSDSSVVSWDVDTQSVSNSTDPTTSTTDSRQKVPENTAHFTPESVDMAIIHSKLASSQPTSKDQYSAVEFSMPRIPLPGELHGIRNHQDSLIQAQPQRQPRTSRTKKSQKSQIPVQAVEMPGSMNDSLDVQFGNLEFGGDSVSSPRKKEEFPAPLPEVEDTRSDEQSSTTSSESPSPPLETQHVVTSLSSSPMATPITIATTASASASVTTLEDSSPRHFQHPSPRAQQQPLVPQVTKQITPEPIPLPPQLDSRENSIPTKPQLSTDQQSSASLQQSGIPSPSLSGTNLNQAGSSSPLRPALSSTMQKDITLETRAYQKHHVTQPTVPSTKDKLGTSSLSSSVVSTSVPRNDLSSVEPLQPPPGVSVPLTMNQATSSTSSGFTSVTMSGTGKPVSHTTKPSLPPGVLPLNTLYGMQQGLIHAYPLPYGYEDLQRLPMSPYYDMPAFQAAGREGLSTTFHGDQKFGRTDASSPVPTSLNQTVTLPQAHLQQQAYINATTMPHPYGYGGLAFYPGAGMMAGGFPAYTTPMYQMPTKTHGNASQYQSAYTSGQHGTHNFASGYDDLGQSHDFGKSGYHTSVSPSQSKSNAGAVVSSASDLSGASYKPQVGKFNENKPFIGGTPPPPALSLSMTGQHGPLSSYPHTGHPFMSMMTPVQQHHPPSHYHHHMAHHMEAGQPGTSQRGSQVQGPKQGQNKGHQGGYQGSPFWSGTN